MIKQLKNTYMSNKLTISRLLRELQNRSLEYLESFPGDNKFFASVAVESASSHFNKKSSNRPTNSIRVSVCAFKNNRDEIIPQMVKESHLYVEGRTPKEVLDKLDNLMNIKGSVGQIEIDGE